VFATRDAGRFAVRYDVTALISVKFLTKWFTTKTLIPFGFYSLVAGLLASFDSPSQKVRDGRRWRDRG